MTMTRLLCQSEVLYGNTSSEILGGSDTFHSLRHGVDELAVHVMERAVPAMAIDILHRITTPYLWNFQPV